MATITQTVYTDDLDGKPHKNVSTVYFSVGTTEYEIDLSPKNADKLRRQLAEFVEHARPLKPQRGGAKRTQVSRPATSGAEQTSALRDWAKQNGYTVSNRGRISQTIRDAFDAAH
jgi:hypothetical protein